MFQCSLSCLDRIVSIMYTLGLMVIISMRHIKRVVNNNEYYVAIGLSMNGRWCDFEQ
jgi:hypothetical protein